MNKLIKNTISAVTLCYTSNVYAASVTNVDVGLTALVSPYCSTTNVFYTGDRDLSTQINADGGIDDASTLALPITNGAEIICNENTTIKHTTLRMVSLNKGLKNGGNLILTYKIVGTFGYDGTKEIQITPFDSSLGSNTDLLHGTGQTIESSPNLSVYLNDQPEGAAVGGHYSDTLTLIVNTSP